VQSDIDQERSLRLTSIRTGPQNYTLTSTMSMIIISVFILNEKVNKKVRKMNKKANKSFKKVKGI